MALTFIRLPFTLDLSVELAIFTQCWFKESQLRVIAVVGWEAVEKS